MLRRSVRLPLMRARMRRGWSSSSNNGARPGSRESDPNQSTHKCFEIDWNGVLRVGRMSVRRLRETTGAPLRDLLQLGLSPAREAPDTQQPAIVLPRDRATLVNLGGLKAVVGPRSALFFDADLLPVRRNVRKIAEAVRQVRRREMPISAAALDDAAAQEDPLPFELVVLEGVLREACGSYQRRCQLYEPVIRSTVSRSTIISSEEDFINDLHRASALDGALATFEAETRGTVGVLVDLLASDEDMLGLLLSDQSNDTTKHGVVELLLESYHRRLAQVASGIAELRAQLASSRELSRVAIDLRRNRIIRFNIYLTITSVGVSTTTAIAGLFGMNLVSGLEESAGAFLVVSGGSAFLGACIAVLATATLDRWYARVDVTDAADDKLALSSLLTNISSLEHLFFVDNNTAAAGRQRQDVLKPSERTTQQQQRLLDRADVAALLRAASGKAPSPRELDLVFQIFCDNHSKNGKTINIEEARKALLHGDYLRSVDEKGVDA